VTSVFRSNEAKVKDAFCTIIHAVLFDERGLDAGCHFGPGRFGLGRFGPGYFGPGRFGIHVMYLNYHNDLLKIENVATILGMFSNKPFKSVKIMMATIIEALCLQ
jgi:hypothetical protein